MNPHLPISPELLAKYEAEIRRLNAPATAKRKMSSLRRFSSWASERGHISPISPMGPISPTRPTLRKRRLKAALLAASGVTTVLLALFLARSLPIGDESPFVALRSLAQLLTGGHEETPSSQITFEPSPEPSSPSPSPSPFPSPSPSPSPRLPEAEQAPSPTPSDGLTTADSLANLAIGGALDIDAVTARLLTVDERANIRGNLQINDITRFSGFGRLASITGYYQDSGLFELDQGAPDWASIDKTLTTSTGAATNDVLTLTLDESALTTGSTRDTLVLSRKGAATGGYALYIKNGDAQFDNNLSIGGSLTASGQADFRGNILDTTGNLTLADDVDITGTLNVTGAATFSSDVTVSTGGQLTLTRQPTKAHTGTWAIGSSTWNQSDATIYVNPTTATADSNIFALAVGGSVKFDIDAEGDIYGNNLILAGSTTTGTTTVAGDLSVEGNTTLGDAVGDTWTANTATLTWAGGNKTIDITGAATRTLTLLNSTASQVANLDLSDGSLLVAGTTRISNAGAGTFTDVTLSGDIAVNGGDITSTSATLTLGGSITTLNCSDCIDFDDLEDTLDLDAALTLNQTTNTWTQSFTGTTTTGLAYTANSLTSGEALDISSTATAFTGNLLDVTLSGSNAANTGNLLRVTNSGTLNAGTALMVTNLGGASSTSFRVNDETGDTDTTPFLIDATGNVGIGTTGPGALLDIGLAGTKLGVVRLAGNTSGNVTIQPAATAGTWTMTLPTSAGSASQFLQTDGTGVTAWATASASTRLDQILAATATNTIANANFAQVWNWGTLTTQTGMTFGGGTAMTTGSIFALGGATYVHTAAETGNLASITFTDASTNTTGNSITNGLNIASTINTSGAGTKAINAISIATPTKTACTTGACTWTGLAVADPGTLANTTFYAATFAGGNVGIGTTSPASKLDVTTTALGTTQTNTSGLALVNTTAAAAGLQQISPALRWRGFGWKTDVTAASQPVDFRSYVVPVQGAAAPTGYLAFDSAVNDGAYSATPPFVITSAGNVGIGTTGPGQKLDVAGNIQMSGDYLRSSSANFNVLATGASGNLYLKSNGAGVVYINNDTGTGGVSIAAGGGDVTFPGSGVWKSTGNVGIGTAGPGQKLTVAGNISLSPGAAQGIIKREVASGSWGLQAFGGTGTPGQDSGSGAYITIGGGAITDGFEGNIDLTAYGGVQNSTTRNVIRFNRRTGVDTVSESMRIDGSGNVGIGTAAPGYKLDVSGDINFSGKFREDGVEILSGMIAPFASACPTGWSEYTSARGRTVVGTPLSGTIAATVGTALTNQGTRTITDVPAHTHGVGTLTAGSAGAHDHNNRAFRSGQCGDCNVFADPDPGQVGDAYTNRRTSTDGAHGHTLSGSTASTGVSSVDVTMPYIQLTYCQKTAGADLAEWIPASEDISQETIVSVDPANREKVIASRKEYDSSVIGIIATQPGWLIGTESKGSVQMALAGRVSTRVTLKNGEIRPGDPITTSTILGVGMKAIKAGPIVGKAMEALNETSAVENCTDPATGRGEKCGTIMVFVNISWHDPRTDENRDDTLIAKSGELFYEEVSLGSDFEDGNLASELHLFAPNQENPTKTEVLRSIRKTEGPLDKNLVGVISKTIGGDGILLRRERVNNKIISETRLIYSGKASVRISPTSSPIFAGDALVPSDTPGLAEKTETASFIVGRALEDWEPGSGKATIKALISPSFYDPDVFLTDAGGFNIVGGTTHSHEDGTVHSHPVDSEDVEVHLHADGSTEIHAHHTHSEQGTHELGFYQLAKPALDGSQKIVTRIGAFSDIVVANLRAGIIQTTDLLAEKIDTVDLITINLVAKNKLISPVVETTEIKTNGKDLVIDLTSSRGAEGDEAISEIASSGVRRTRNDGGSGFGKLLVKGDVEIEGHAQVQALDVVNDATVSGTLRAKRIEANEILGLEGTFEELSASVAATQTLAFERATQANSDVIARIRERIASLETTVNSKESKVNRSEIAELLNETATPSASLTFSASTWEAAPVTASDSAAVSEIASATPRNDALANDVITSNAITNNLDLTGGLNVLGNANFYGSTTLADILVTGTLNVVGEAATSLLALTSSEFSLFSGKFVVDAGGDVLVQGNLTVEGTLKASAVEAERGGFGELLVKDISGETATFAQVTTPKLVIASRNTSQGASSDSSEVESNATAGRAVLPRGQTSLLISNSLISNNSLVYVVPEGSTNNTVLYVASKAAGESFTVAVDRPVPYDVPFSWWIIELL